ncbi:NAD(P)-dependent oxidoreductase [Sagittula sp. NFXS13]|uniref:NAD-dependent epimerase/dehydratase family protein n=1 Tax=Sagittula sp. NFXS13 TaxID=2819095 RepID=UPI0032DF47EA
MGEMTALTIAITGANGFVGRACVAEARRQGFPVLAVTRSAPLPQWADDAGITHLRLDLTDADAAQRLAEALPESAALIHAAAHLGDDPERLARDTMTASATVRDTLRLRPARLILISSLAVYDTDRLAPGEAMTEATPLIPLPSTPANARDAYAGAKRMQEALLAEALRDGWTLRPGVIWGPGRSWHALQGFWASKLFVTIGSEGELPLAHVDHVARAAIAAAQTSGPGTVNVFDDDRPTRARFLRAHKRCYGWPRINTSVPYGAWAGMAGALGPLSAKLPGLFQPSILRARMMPLTYPNTALRNRLGGEDIDSFEGMMARTKESE